MQAHIAGTHWLAPSDGTEATFLLEASFARRSTVVEKCSGARVEIVRREVSSVNSRPHAWWTLPLVRLSLHAILECHSVHHPEGNKQPMFVGNPCVCKCVHRVGQF